MPLYGTPVAPGCGAKSTTVGAVTSVDVVNVPVEGIPVVLRAFPATSLRPVGTVLVVMLYCLPGCRYLRLFMARDGLGFSWNASVSFGKTVVIHENVP